MANPEDPHTSVSPALLGTVSFPLSILSQIPVGAGVIIASILGYIIYQVYFHPLARCPGPWLENSPEVEAAYHAAKGDLHLHIIWCQNHVSQIVRYTPDLVIFNPESGLQKKKKLRQEVHYGAIQVGTKNLLTVTSPKEHAKRTKIIGPGFSSTTMWECEPNHLSHVPKFRDSLYLAQFYFAFDVIIDLVFGKARNLLGSQHFQCTVFLGRLGEKLFKDVRGMKRYHRLVNGMMADAASMSGHVFSPGLTDADVYSESAMLAVGSYFTPKLAHNVWSVLPTPDDIRSSQLMQQCTYFQACIKETLRNSPAVARCPYRPVEKGDTIIRWLSNEAELRTEKLGVISAASTTFSQGTHAYIGRHLAQLELQLALVSIIPAGAGIGPTNSQESQLYEHIISQKRGPILHFGCAGRQSKGQTKSAIPPDTRSNIGRQISR
ncbi:cytochrome P450 [Aspergillus welwitschiae]|uniref:Cytochrome P450 n=1 Tax=Aspergillus welwitschiae TaxID=1341132 RepID=A0A3F3QBQ5_9EURO|nr:cytochrome P450 [Aspergillus welwitschiae]RDH36547.1 cytochrome P450 [Aspergillus welwitschiae]